MFKLMNKKIIAILHKFFLLNWPYVTVNVFSYSSTISADNMIKKKYHFECQNQIIWTENSACVKKILWLTDQILSRDYLFAF